MVHISNYCAYQFDKNISSFHYMSIHHEKQLLLTSFSDNFIQIWYLISYPMYWCVIILHLCINLCSYTCVHYYRTVLPVQSPHLMISWLSTGTTVLQIYHKFLNHVSLALTMEVLLSTCFVTPRFKFFTLTVYQLIIM